MNITRENIDDLNLLLKLKIEKNDYHEKVESVLKDYRKKANIKGFRPGMVPMGMIKKIYGHAVQIDEMNKVVSNTIHEYLKEQQLDILGEPLPSEDEQESIDLDNQEDFTFSFEVGLAPSFDISLGKNDSAKLREIQIDDKMRNDYIDGYKRRFGELRNTDSSEEKDVLKGSIAQAGEDNNPAEGGIAVESTSVGIDIIKDEEIKKQFLGKNVGDSVVFDLRKAFPNDSEIAGILHMTKKEAEDINGNFIFTINEISRFYPAELNTDLYDKIWGEGLVTSEDEFTAKIDEEIAASLKNESDYRLMIDLKALVLEKIAFGLPDEFLKRWLLKANEKTTKEQIESEYDSFRKDLRWQLIRNRIARDNDLKISDEELQHEAENITRQQFRQYGFFYATDDQVANYAKETLKREEDARRIADKILEDKVLGIVKDMVTLEPESITVEEFNKLFEQA